MMQLFSQNKQRAIYRYAMFGLLGGLVALALASRMLGLQVHVPTTILLVASFALGIWGFTTLDEVAKQAHYVAWFWGGMVALIVVAVIIAASSVMPLLVPLSAFLEKAFGRADAETGFLLGLAAGPVLLTLGYIFWWTAFWLRRR
jgi:hypothetical protein